MNEIPTKKFYCSAGGHCSGESLEGATHRKRLRTTGLEVSRVLFTDPALLATPEIPTF